MILAVIDKSEGQIKKSSLEAICYAAKLAQQMSTHAAAVVLGTTTDNLADLGKYGVEKIYQVAYASLDQLDTQVYAQVLAQVVEKTGTTVVVFSHNLNGKAVAPRLSARLKAGLVAGAVALPETADGQFVVRKNVFSGKAFANVAVNTPVRIISLNPNAFPVSTHSGTAQVEALEVNIPAARVKVTGSTKADGEIPLTEAETVVSGGRGLKGPEHWGILEDLAKALGAATACSRPVADADWRPHHEHVGQTGFAIAPNLYVAIGISGAIQHLAGVNRSKVIVVINKDPEAPFFKAADYGIVGDAFEVVPKLTEAVRRLKGN